LNASTGTDLHSTYCVEIDAGPVPGGSFDSKLLNLRPESIPVEIPRIDPVGHLVILTILLFGVGIPVTWGVMPTGAPIQMSSTYSLNTGPEGFQMGKVDINCTYYATFQSHNQKVVQNENGIFMTYLLDYEDEAPWPGRWCLLRSVDGGSTFQAIYTSPKVGSKAACIETDDNNNILAVCGDETAYDQPFLFHRFLASKGYSDPEITRIRHSSSGKYSMMYDSGIVYLFNHYGKLLVINATTGRLIFRKQVVEFSGENATTQYPHVYVGQDDVLHHAWTTSHKDIYLYWDIHYTNSPDGGKSWYRADQTRLTTPMKPDHSGKSDQVILPDEFEYHTWLSSMIVKAGKAHFAYLAQTPDVRQHYVRIDLESGEIDHRIQPRWGGETISIRGLDGFFVTGPGSSPLFYAGPTNFTHIGVIASYDNGLTWHDIVVGPGVPDSIYSVGGFREITSDDHIIGSFTNQYGSRGDPYFFRVKVEELPARGFLGVLLLASALFLVGKKSGRTRLVV